MTAERSRVFQHLHSLLKQLHDAEYLLDHGPKRLAAAKMKVEAARQACADQKEVIVGLKKAADQNSLNLKSREAVLQKLNGQLNQATSNKEYDIFQAQIAAEKAANADLEDKILSLLSDVDESAAELKRREQQVAEFEQKAAEVEADVKAREPGLQAEVARLNAEIAEAEKTMPGGEKKSAYHRLRAAQGPGAMARVDDGYCTECNTGATQQDVVRLNLGEFVLCRACGRILYQVGEEV
ncbi:MAG: hypothetical protein RIK87_02635 [Fuerstiella sp.]